MRVRCIAVLVVIAVSSGSGCAVTGVAYRTDDRLTFVTPEDRADVTLPVTVRWEVKDFSVPTDGSFAVFVDRAPQPRGKPLRWLARDDDGCREENGCPDAAWYAERNVYPTTELGITLDQLPARADDRREFHEVTVVLLDPDQRRIAETGWSIEFEVARS